MRRGCNGEREKRKKRVAFQYKFESQVICAAAFRYIYSLGSREFRNLQMHLAERALYGHASMVIKAESQNFQFLFQL